MVYVIAMNVQTSQKAKYHLKIIVCGAGAVGKTSIVRRYIEDRFEHNYLLTIGLDPSNRHIEVNGNLVNLIIYDVAGQKRFQALREIFFRKANGALLVFDLTRPETLDELYEWQEQIEKNLGKDQVPSILIGNKSDLEDQIRIAYDDLEDEIIPEFKPIKYLETSALADINIREAFELLTREILQREGII